MNAAPFIQTLWRLLPLYEHYEGCSIYMNIIKAVSFTMEEGCFPFLPSVYSLAGPCIHSSGIRLNVISWTPNGSESAAIQSPLRSLWKLSEHNDLCTDLLHRDECLSSVFRCVPGARRSGWQMGHAQSAEPMNERVTAKSGTTWADGRKIPGLGGTWESYFNSSPVYEQNYCVTTLEEQTMCFSLSRTTVAPFSFK